MITDQASLRESVRSVEIWLLETSARAQAANLATVPVPVNVLGAMALVLAKACMMLDGPDGSPAPTGIGDGPAAAMASFEAQVQRMVDEAHKRAVESMQKAGTAPATPAPG